MVDGVSRELAMFAYDFGGVWDCNIVSKRIVASALKTLLKNQLNKRIALIKSHHKS